MRLKNIKPASLALMLLALGSFSSCIHYSGQSGSDKLSSLLYVIGHQYVDTVDMDELVEKTIPKVLSELDPHSVYIPAKDAEESNQELRGSFSGIGIQFMIQSDTIYVSNIIPGGPAEKVGLMAGDRIVTIDDSLYVGKVVSNDGAMKRLKGPKGSEVRLGVKRYGEPELQHRVEDAAIAMARACLEQGVLEKTFSLRRFTLRDGAEEKIFFTAE